VFFDASCHACNAEISLMQRAGEKQGIEFVEISTPEFEEIKHRYINYSQQLTTVAKCVLAG
jgi:predicted DCC family thiol-disulfide oxidoreductase YuxK